MRPNLKTKLVGILTVAAAVAIHAQAPPFLTNRLVAYYPFNGNANDVSGNTNNGTLFGAATFGTDRFGNADSCLSLPGTAGTGSGVNIPTLTSNSYQPVTYSAWFLLSNYPPAPSFASVMTLVGREQCGNGSVGAVCLFSQAGTGLTNILSYYTGAGGYATGLVPPTNKWCQVVFTIGSAGTGSFYFNGTNVHGTGSFSPGQPLEFTIGVSAAPNGDCTANHYVWNGLIDDVLIYNHKHPFICATTSIGCVNRMVHLVFVFLQPVLPE